MSDGNDNNLGKQILQKRKDLKLTQREVAEKAGISRNYVSMIERGTATNISFSIVSKLGIALDIPIPELVFGQPVEDPSQEAYITMLEETLAASQLAKEGQGDLLIAVLDQMLPGIAQLLVGQTALIIKMAEIDTRQAHIDGRIRALGGDTIPYEEGTNDRWFWDIAHNRVVYVHEFAVGENGEGVSADVSWFPEPDEPGHLLEEGRTQIPATLLLKISSLVDLPY